MLSAAYSTLPQAPVCWVITDSSGVIIHTSTQLHTIFEASSQGQTIASLDPSLSLLLPSVDTPLTDVSSLILPNLALCVQLEPIDVTTCLWIFRSLPKENNLPTCSLNQLHQEAWLLPYTRDMVSVHDEDGHMYYVSPSVHSLLGYEEARFLQLSIFSIIHPDFKPRIFLYSDSTPKIYHKILLRGYNALRWCAFSTKSGTKHGNWRWV
ncbi:MAG: PAS domain S-box protein [Saprospiraceae bacterium]|nr:PAS domain S-box protein [Saprospiraceae bacterium]